MRILISNDDGVYAPGIAALHGALADFADCVVVAPSKDQSGVSSALTLDRPLYAEPLANGWLSINGTPADCVHLGLNGLLDTPPEMVVAGINLGANLGDDVLYSGTVAAAMEGRFLGHTAFAFSLLSRSPENLATAAHFARLLVAAHERLDLPQRTVLNVNIPDLPLSQIRGIRATRLGQRRRAAAPIPHTNPRGKQGFWLAVAGEAEDGGEGTDFHAVQQGFVSITPLHLGHRDLPIETLKSWLSELAA